MTDTRTQIIQAATECFADKGFYGASIAMIVEDLPYTKQTLLHHFGSKEKLYGEVLKKISSRLISELESIDQSRDSGKGLIENTFIEFYRTSIEHGDETQLLMRELLDNKRRAETAKTWYLKPFLDEFTRIYAEALNIRDRSYVLAPIYQILGAINYFVVSRTTLRSMYGEQQFLQLEKNYERELRQLISNVTTSR